MPPLPFLSSFNQLPFPAATALGSPWSLMSSYSRFLPSHPLALPVCHPRPLPCQSLNFQPARLTSFSPFIPTSLQPPALPSPLLSALSHPGPSSLSSVPFQAPTLPHSGLLRVESVCGVVEVFVFAYTGSWLILQHTLSTNPLPCNPLPHSSYFSSSVPESSINCIEFPYHISYPSFTAHSISFPSYITNPPIYPLSITHPILRPPLTVLPIPFFLPSCIKYPLPPFT